MLPRLKSKQFSPKQLQQIKNKLGLGGEEKARHFLQKLDYKILASNLTLGKSEIDLVCLNQAQNEVVFVEVKTRSVEYYGHPSQAVGHRQMRSLDRVARKYLQANKLDLDYRFDIVSVLPNKIEHFQNITWFRGL